MAPLYHQFTKTPGFSVKLCNTAQHREMLDQVLSFFEITPDFDLNLMKQGQTLNELSASILTTMDEVLQSERPDLVLVHGDTTTSSMVALAAFHKGIKVGHVEAGLRTFNKNAPFPEEINRQITGRLADLHFAPTKQARNNLLKEGIKKETIIVTGNTVIDALIWTRNKIDKGFQNLQIEELNNKISSSKLVLVTGHRRENFGKGFIDFCESLIEISKNKNVAIIFPVHLNPNVQEPVNRLLSGVKNIHLISPVEYPVMVWLMQKAHLIISDSGGIQEEAPTFHKQILVTREVSERPEGVASGFSILVGTNKDIIVEKANYLLTNTVVIDGKNPYGNGRASQKIINYLLKSQ